MAGALVGSIRNLSLEDVTARQRKERKDLQAKIMQVKKSVPKGDKKRQKEVQLQVTQMETEFEQKCKDEISSIEAVLQTKEVDSRDETAETTSDNESLPAQKTSKAEKRREKKRQQDLEREGRIAEQAKVNETLPRAIEKRFLVEKLLSSGLKIYDIVPDGNCLFSAVSHQLRRNCRDVSAMELRKLCANNLREHRTDFEAFIIDDDFDTYCDRIEKDQACWGGQVELQALSKQLQCKIVVYQADEANIEFGDDKSEMTLRLSFHRHLIKSGEHYNSVIEIPQVDE